MNSKRWLELLRSSRPVSWVNTAYPFAAGYFVSTGQADWKLVVGSLYFLIPYNLLMYGINDVFDYESDLRNPRKGGIEGAVLDRSLHRLTLWAAVASNLPFIALLLLAGSVWAAATLAAVVFMVVAYSAPKLRFKERPVLDSVTSASHFVGPLVFALALAGFPATAWPVVAAFFAWSMASHAFGAVQDIKADRAGGISSIATVFGARRTVRLSLGLYLAAALAIVLTHRSAWAISLAGLAYVINIWPYRNLTDADCERSHPGWRRFIWLNLVTGATVTITLLQHFL